VAIIITVTISPSFYVIHPKYLNHMILYPPTSKTRRSITKGGGKIHHNFLRVGTLIDITSLTV